MGAKAALQEAEMQGGGQTLAIGAASTRTTVALDPGRNVMLATVDCWFRRGDNAVNAATEAAASAAHLNQPLLARTYWFEIVTTDDNTNDYLAVIAMNAGETGFLYIRRCS